MLAQVFLEARGPIVLWLEVS